jgi:Grx4 family monothiol glutaredoxin
MSIQLSSVEEYHALVKDNTKAGVLVHFHASWCAPCTAVQQHVDGLLMPKYQGNVTFVSVDVEKFEALCESLQVDSVPHVAIYRRGNTEPERVAEVSGAKLPQLDQNMFSLFGNGREDKAAHATLDDYLKYLIRKDKIVAFITGTPSRPRCGFTGKLIELFAKHGVNYCYYDIMADNEVCDGLKKFSEWPTYPQIYVDGELIGGYDICVEMDKSNELKKALKME